MSPPAFLTDNLVWTRSGSVWAFWRLHALDYGYRPQSAKDDVRLLHQALLRNLPGEAVLLSACIHEDPVSVVERMVAGVDLDLCPAWAEECMATLDTVASLDLPQRTWWLGVLLTPADGWSQLKQSAAAGWRSFTDSLALAPRSLSAAVVADSRYRAGVVQAGIPSALQPTPATPAQLTWLYGRAQTRGLPLETALPSGVAGDLAEKLLTPRWGAGPSPVVLDEGARSDLGDRTAGRAAGRLRTPFNPLSRRYLKVMTAGPGDTVDASYQVMMALRGVPDGAYPFPGGELLGRVDESGVNVDMTVRLTVRSRDDVARRNRRAVVNLNEQVRQRAGEASIGVRDLDLAHDALAALSSALAGDRLEVEIRPTIMFAVGGTSAHEAVGDARDFGSWLESAGYRVDQPVGTQSILWSAMLPGAAPHPQLREWEQVSTSLDFSALVPLAGADLGDRHGSLLGLNISRGAQVAPSGVVLHDLAGAPGRDVSGSLGVVGELGSGKSVVLKKLAGDVVDRGGIVVAVDRTELGEWVAWAGSVTDVTVADVVDPTMSLDPLRLFPPALAGRALHSFLTPLLDVTPTSEWGLLLSDVLTPDYLLDHAIGSSGELVRHLALGAMSGAAELARALKVYATRDVGRVVFDDSLPPVRLGSAALVIRTAGLKLPHKLELETPHLFRQLPLETLFGRAMYALVAAIARRVCFSNSTFSAFVVDEAHHVTASPEGAAELEIFVRDGRKHAAAALLASQDPSDFGSDTLRGLIPTRILMRQRDEILARRGLQWLDMDPADEDLVTMVRTDTSPTGPDGVPAGRRGEGFMRDANGRVGRVRVLLPAAAARAAATLTTPGPSTHRSKQLR